MKRRVTFTTKPTPCGCSVELAWSSGRKQSKRFRNGYAIAMKSAEAWIKEQINGIKEHVLTSKVKLEMPEIIVDGKEWEEPAKPLALDVSLERARALHRVYRSLHDGDCPKCHKYHAVNEIIRGHRYLSDAPAVMCPSCNFNVTHEEVDAIKKMFAHAMDAATKIFEEWREERASKRKAYDNALAYWENEKYMFPESEWSEREPKLEEFIK